MNAKTGKKDLKMMSAETKRTKDVETDKKPAEQAELDDTLCNFFPGISYFIAFTPNESCDLETLFQFLYFRNTETEISYIKTRVKHESEERKTLKDCQENCLMYLKITIMKLYSTLSSSQVNFAAQKN